MGLGLAGQQRFGIRLGAVGLVVEPDAAAVTPGAFLALLGSTESLLRTCRRRRWILLPITALAGRLGLPYLKQRGIHAEMPIAEQWFQILMLSRYCACM